MLLRILASSRYFTLVAIAGTFLGSSALVLYEAAVIGASLADIWRAGDVSPKAVKLFAVGMIEAVDVFLIAIALYIISLGLYALFVDDRLPLPRWLLIRDLDDLKTSLDTIRSQSSSFGSNLSIVENRQDFTKKMINTLKGGADNLVLADANEEAANLLALQTRQQLSQTALSLANQADQGVLRLF